MPALRRAVKNTRLMITSPAGAVMKYCEEYVSLCIIIIIIIIIIINGDLYCACYSSTVGALQQSKTNKS